MHPFELLKRQLDEMAKSRQVEQAKEEAAARELRKAQADLSLDEAIALYGTQLEASTEAADSAQKGRAIKSRGIALTHMAGQGGAANGRNTPLLMKSAEVIKGLRRVDINKASRPLKATNMEGAE
ncbi:hypothetical protein R2297_002287 [Cronobacter sakazakii]|nr:hypothetical protein [Cronobacter sakazakii]ELQ6175042.1 hypothetical protein [Cronobacter sakazakii]ELQ6187710.1 hypothetical protein [Cronobacter sakazakii]